jgi:glycosyltransferase involved in cell wall biosynthesis
MTHFGFVSTYPPTRCGLASFTRSLSRALTGPRDTPPSIVRMLDPGEDTGLVPDDVGRVVGVVRTDDPAAHRAAARALGNCDVVIVQHEYGIFGGDDGEDVIGLLEALEVPSITVLHTVLPSPSPNQKRVLEKVAELSTAVVVMTDHALETLVATYDIDPARVTVIPHGVVQTADSGQHHRGSVPRILTWGLLSPSKGLERGIRAVALLNMRGLAAEYVIAGETHPKVRAHSGEAYRESLAGLARALGVRRSVEFVDQYMTDEDLSSLLRSADAVLLPYDSHEQATSGVLVEAVAAGVPVVATAFPHAIELLSDGAGIVVPHDDLAGMAEALESILFTETASAPVPDAKPRGGTGLSWPQVATRYATLAGRLRAVQAA